MEQWRNGPSIHANQNNQEGAHKSKNQDEFATVAMPNELSGKVPRHAKAEAIQSFRGSWGGKALERLTSGAAALHHVTSTSPKVCATDSRGVADNWLLLGRLRVCFGICSFDFQALSSHDPPRNIHFLTSSFLGRSARAGQNRKPPREKQPFLSQFLKTGLGSRWLGSDHDQ